MSTKVRAMKVYIVNEKEDPWSIDSVWLDEHKAIERREEIDGGLETHWVKE